MAKRRGPQRRTTLAAKNESAIDHSTAGAVPSASGFDGPRIIRTRAIASLDQGAGVLTRSGELADPGSTVQGVAGPVRRRATEVSQ